MHVCTGDPTSSSVRAQKLGRSFVAHRTHLHYVAAAHPFPGFNVISLEGCAIDLGSDFTKRLEHDDDNDDVLT